MGSRPALPLGAKHPKLDLLLRPPQPPPSEASADPSLRKET